jgi:hypothetical protein
MEYCDSSQGTLFLGCSHLFRIHYGGLYFWQSHFKNCSVGSSGSCSSIEFAFSPLTYRRAEVGLNTLGDDGSGLISRSTIALGFTLILHPSCLASGLGFGSMSGVMQFNMVLDSYDGPGSLPSPGCTTIDFSVVSGFQTSNQLFIFSPSHILLHYLQHLLVDSCLSIV